MHFVIWTPKRNVNRKILKVVKFGEQYGIQSANQDLKMQHVVYVKLNVLQVLEMMGYIVLNPMLMEEVLDILGNLVINHLIILMPKKDVKKIILHWAVKFGEPYTILNAKQISIM
jgi:hypothetical protein